MLIFLYHGLKKIEDTVIEADGLRMTVNGKSSGGKQVVVSVVSPLMISAASEIY